MLKGIQRVGLAIGAAAALAIGGAVIADAASKKDSTTAAPPAAAAQSSPRAQHPGEKLLTGDAAQKVKDAALKKVSGATVIRVETDAEGSPYEAHLRKSDGSEVTAKVNKDFEVTKVEQGMGAGPGGRGPGGPPPNGSGVSY
jgi:hypothetical protein